MREVTIQYSENDTYIEKSKTILSLVKLMTKDTKDRLNLLLVVQADAEAYIYDMENRINLMNEL